MSHFNLAVLHRKPGIKEIERLLLPFDECTSDPRYCTFVEDEECDPDEATGHRGYYRNPNAKYDWWGVGNRWNGQLRLKAGAQANTAIGPESNGRCNSAKIKNINFSPLPKDYQDALRIWELSVERATPTPEEKEYHLFLYSPKYYLDLYGDKENYARQMSEFSTYAYLTEDGVWHEPGRMGWFGCSDQTRDTRDVYRRDFRRDVIEADPELYLTIVDCHI